MFNKTSKHSGPVQDVDKARSAMGAESRLDISPDDFAREIAAATVEASSLTARLKAITAATTTLERQVTVAGAARRVASIGIVKRVVLYDTELHLPGIVVPLSPAVSASADHQGNKQVVQGWVRRSTNDRREMMLFVEWPGGYKAVAWERNDKKTTGSLVTPSEVHSMAAAINMAATEAPATYAEKQRHVDDAKDALRRHLEIEDSNLLTAIASADDRAGVLRMLLAEREAKISSASDKGLIKRCNREIKVTSKKLAALSASVQVAHTTRAANLDRMTWAAPASVPTETSQSGLTSGSSEVPLPGTSGSAITAETLAILEKLGELRDAGILTREEFDRKKADVLRLP